MKQKNITTLEAETWLKNSYNAFKTSIRRSVVVEKSTHAFLPLPAFSKNGIATKDYKAVVEELLMYLGDD
jgi:chromosome partitioning protein